MLNKRKQKRNGYYELSIFTTSRNYSQLKMIARSIKRKMNPKLSIFVILRHITEAYKKIVSAVNTYIDKTIIELLDMILPHDYFGSSQNRKHFYFIVNRITTQSRGECVFKSSLYKGFNLECMKWVQEAETDPKRQKQILYHTNWYILENIVKPLIRNFYYCLRSIKTYEIKFVPFKQWNTFQTKVFKSLIEKKHLIPGDFSKPRGSLQLFPRGDLNQQKYRPIVRTNPLPPAQKIKINNLLKKIRQLTLFFSKSSSIKEHIFWKKCTELIGDKNLCGIALDLEDAYGNVNIGKLCQVIAESKFDLEDKRFLLSHIQNQQVKFNKKIFKWSHGLLQGDQLSPCLSNLYLSVLEQEHLSNFMQSSYRLHRVVDDYLFCTTDITEIESFQNTFRKYFPLNESKIQTANVNDRSELVYCGKLINFKTKQISKHFDAKETCLRHKFKLWSDKVPKTKAEIINAAVSFRRTYHYFRYLKYSRDPEIVLTQYFKGITYVAFKFDMTVRAVKDFKQKSSDMPYLLRSIKNTITVHAKKAYHYLGGAFNFGLLRIIAKKAFIIVLKKNLCFYKDVIDALHVKRNLFINLPGEHKHFAKIFTKIPLEFKKIEMKRVSNI